MGATGGLSSRAGRVRIAEEPAGSGSIWITIGLLEWHSGGEAERAHYEVWDSSHLLDSFSSTNPTGSASNTLPEWTLRRVPCSHAAAFAPPLWRHSRRRVSMSIVVKAFEACSPAVDDAYSVTTPCRDDVRAWHPARPFVALPPRSIPAGPPRVGHPAAPSV